MSTVHRLFWRVKGQERWHKGHQTTSCAEFVPHLLGDVHAKGIWVHLPPSEVEVKCEAEEVTEDLFAGKI